MNARKNRHGFSFSPEDVKALNRLFELLDRRADVTQAMRAAGVVAVRGAFVRAEARSHTSGGGDEN